MTHTTIVLLLFTMLLPQLRGGDQAKGDIANMQGTWVVTNVVRNKDKQKDFSWFDGLEKITIKDNVFTFHAKGTRNIFAFAIDPSKKPKTLSTIVRKPGKGAKGSIDIVGIYSLEKDELKLAFKNIDDRGTFPFGPPPEDFGARDGTSTTWILKREKGTKGRKSPAPGSPTSTPLTVADVVKGLALNESKFSYSDEPPGKLRELECLTTLRDTKVKVRVRIEVVYTTALFSDKREWDIMAVRAATVRKVSIEAQPAEK